MKKINALLLIGCLFFLASTAFSAETAWEKTIDNMVKNNIAWTYWFNPVSGGPRVTTLQPNTEYLMTFYLRNKGTEVFFEEIQVRLVSKGKNQRINFYTFCPPPTGPIGVPCDSELTQRLHFSFNNVRAEGTGDNYRFKVIRVKTVFTGGPLSQGATTTVKPILFHTGIYGHVRPIGHTWKNALW